MKKTNSQFKIFNICAFDKALCAYVIDRYLDNLDLAIAQATHLKASNEDLYVYVVGYKNRKDPKGSILWESDKSE